MPGRSRCRPAVLGRVTRDRVIGLIEGDLDLLVRDAKERPISEQSVEEMLVNRDVPAWLRGGPLPGRGAADLLEDNLAVFRSSPTRSRTAPRLSPGWSSHSSSRPSLLTPGH